MEEPCRLCSGKSAFVLGIIFVNTLIVHLVFDGFTLHARSAVLLPIAPNHQTKPASNKSIPVEKISDDNILQKVKELLRRHESAAQSLVQKLRTEIFAPAKKWHELPDKFERLEDNVIYQKFKLEPVDKKEKLDLILIVSSAPKRLARREATRETWWPECKSTERIVDDEDLEQVISATQFDFFSPAFQLKIKCVFLTDWYDPSTDTGKDLREEQEKYGDLFFQNLEGGTDFGKRFVYHMFWAMTHYDFNYMMRIDDDYFMCIKRLISEVPMPPRQRYHWGWVHCDPNILRPDESMMLFSRDLIETYLGQDPETMVCHKWADEMVGIWHERLNMQKILRHDPRLYHDPPAAFVPRFKTEQNICQTYIGVHGSYPEQMRILWKHRGSDSYPSGKILDDYSSVCQFKSKMDWRSFHGSEWYGEPLPCKDNPIYTGPRGELYKGRQGH